MYMHFLCTQSSAVPYNNLFASTNLFCLDLVIPIAKTIPSQYRSTNNSPPYVVSNDLEERVGLLLSQHIPRAGCLWHYSCCAFILLNIFLSAAEVCCQEA